jgi:hypothetical protein
MKLKVHRPTVIKTVEQTACWYRKIELDPGEYEIEALGPLPYFRHVRVPGTIIEEHFPSGFGGMYYANPNDGKNVGKRTVHVMSLPDSCDREDNNYGWMGRDRFNAYHKGDMELCR